MKLANHSLSARQIVNAVADAAGRWCDADFPARVRATRDVMARTGYAEPVVDYALDALFGELSASAIEAAIAGELGALAALDTFVSRPGRPDVTYAPVGGVAVLSSSTTIGVAIPALAFALCAKASVCVKDRSDRLVAAFAESMTVEQPALAAAMRVETWDGSDARAIAENVHDAHVVVAYGNDATLAAIRSEMQPLARLVPFGHRTSVAYVGAGDVRDDVAARACARGIATDALLYDGEGCLSVHIAFVERGGAVEPAAFAKLLAAACDDVAVEFPATFTELDPQAASIRKAALFRAAQGQGAVYGGAIAPHLVVLDTPFADLPPWARRTLALYAVDTSQQAAEFLQRHAIALEAVATGPASRPDVEAMAIACGASRIARFGALQRPPMGGEHGGFGRILPFVRAIYK